jgi:hypothetical protein
MQKGGEDLAALFGTNLCQRDVSSSSLKAKFAANKSPA